MELEELLESAKDTRSPFGEVPGRGTPTEWLGSMSESSNWIVEHWPAVRVQVSADVLRLSSSGWRESDKLYAPVLFSPGDGPALRAAALGLDLTSTQIFDEVISGRIPKSDDWFMMRVLAATLARAERLVSAELAFLPASTAVTLLAGFRPDPELYEEARLPHKRMLVFFGAPLRFTAGSTWWEESHVEVLDRVDLALGRNNGLPEAVARKQLPSNLFRNGGALAAVWLESDEEGKLLDDVGFIGFENESGRLTLPRFSIGSMRLSTLAPLVENLVCALCWGHWSVNGDRPTLPDPSTREFRRLVGTSSFKRQARSGTVDGVRLLELRQETVTRGTRTVGDSTRTVAPHLRRGHFRRVRVVTRDTTGNLVGSRTGMKDVDWNYQGRWIPPTVVNPHGPEQEPVNRVYLLPEPPSPDEYDAHRRVKGETN